MSRQGKSSKQPAPMTAEEEDLAKAAEIDEETRQIKKQTDKEYDDALDTTQRMLKLTNETRNVGAQTMGALKEQEEQLDRIENKQEKIGSNLDEADKQLNILERWFCCCFARDSGKKIKISEETRRRRAEEAEMRAASSGNSRKADGAASKADQEELTEGRSARRERRERERNNNPDRDARDEQIDENLEGVGDIVSDLLEQSKEMGVTLERQNEQLDRISKKVDKNSEHVQTATKRANNVNTGLFAF